ncbi:MAG: alpha/beta fold hydrolase [Gemmatimonadales bacterium]
MGTIDHRGQAIYFEDRGSGPAVVLGHSFLCTGAMWREQVPELAARYRVLNLDLRGHGRSGPAAAPFTLYDAVGDVLAVLDHLGIERAVWCGLSIGGMVALRAALVAPERVRALVLLDSDAGAETAGKKLKYSAMGMVARLAGIGPVRSAVSRLMFGATTRRSHPSLVSEWEASANSLHVPSVLRGLEALVTRDSLLARLPEITVPALVMVGDEDRSLPPPHSRRIQAGLPNARFELIPGAGHLAALERPDVVTRAMLGFLDALPPPGESEPAPSR